MYFYNTVTAQLMSQNMQNTLYGTCFIQDWKHVESNVRVCVPDSAIWLTDIVHVTYFYIVLYWSDLKYLNSWKSREPSV